MALFLWLLEHVWVCVWAHVWRCLNKAECVVCLVVNLPLKHICQCGSLLFVMLQTHTAQIQSCHFHHVTFGRSTVTQIISLHPARGLCLQCDFWLLQTFAGTSCFSAWPAFRSNSSWSHSSNRRGKEGCVQGLIRPEDSPQCRTDLCYTSINRSNRFSCTVCVFIQAKNLASVFLSLGWAIKHNTCK